MSFRILGLDPKPFVHLYGLADAALAQEGVRRFVVDQPRLPDRIEVRDAELGESLLLLNYVHQPADTPYHASHAIFVREGAMTPYDAVDEVPDSLRTRTLSLRVFDDGGDMVDAALVDGREIEPAIAKLRSEERRVGKECW